MNCKQCGSYAINAHLHGRQKGIDLDYCDVCYWRFRAEKRIETELAEARAEIERKDKLIEQMREALEFLRETQGYKAVNGKDSKYIHMRSEAWSKCGFALDAAERNEGL